MKKLVIASAIVMAVSAGSAMASTAQSNVEFIGSVTDVTCDLGVSQTGSVNNVIQLGTVAPGAKGDAKEFALVAKNAAACNSALTGKTVTVYWNGNLGANGIDNQSGTATNSYVILTPVNASAANPVKKNANSVTFTDAATKLNEGGEGLKFTAELQAGSTAGTFQTATAYAVEYY